MSLTLTVLLSLLSAGILAGRVYEILNLTDAFTGFLIVNGVVMNPYVIGLFVVITLCCGILIFGSGKAAVPYYSKSSKVTCILAGVGFVAAAVPAMQFEVTAPFFIAGGAALIIMGITGLGKKKTDIAVMLLMLGFAAGMCMDVVSFDVNTYHNTVFVQNVMEYLCIIAFMLTVVKNVYLPSKYSRMFLYVTGMLSFSVCSMMNVADIICYFITGGQALYKLFMYIATAMFGVFAFDTAISAIPVKNKKKTVREDKYIHDESVEKDYAEERADMTVSEENDAFDKSETEDKTELTEVFAVNELEKMFEAIAEERAEKNTEGSENDVYTAEEFLIKEETDENAIKHTMFSELFGRETQDYIPSEHHSILSETRSFKKISQPKLDESAHEYDMLKSMFKGEDTSQYQFEAEETENTTARNSEKKKKRSFFGGSKKENTARGKSVTEKSASEHKNVSGDTIVKERTKFTAEEQTAGKLKSETKKIVYKKPK